ncbi:TolC family protein [Novosphingobium terrae]|uniref:TolC family protein n=1 Tax=Novosphingobium terrae TaxID=2726189 RepID=UPI00197D6D6D|nr:TolC family protein [Novosphingobium terrae]
MKKAPRRAVLLAGLCGCLSACAHYTPLPLPREAALAPTVAALPAPQAEAAPLGVDQVVALALANNPELQAIRARHAIARGDLKQAGLLPNPSLTGAFLPLLSGVGTVPAWNIGLSQNIRSLIVYSSKKRAAGFAARQVDADIVWQEWQVAGQARQLAVDLIVGQKSRASYEAAWRLLRDRNAKAEAALAAGNLTLVVVAPGRVALQTARAALNTLDQKLLSQRHQLNALLGLSADATIPLSDQAQLPPIDPAAIRAGLASLADRRPDLLALRMGYGQADEQVRQAILSQFPDLVLGGGIASDNSRVINAGPNVAVPLPVFDRGQGTIAIARATRAQLHADYAARLKAATGQVEAMLAEMAQLAQQLAAVRRDLPAARIAADRAAKAFGASTLDERAYIDLLSNRYTKEQDVMTLELALLDRQVALQTLVGIGLPAVNAAPQGAGQ